MLADNDILRGKSVMKRLVAPALAPLMLLAACEAKKEAAPAPTQPAETRTAAAPASAPTSSPAAAAFQHDPKVELAGYYDAGTTVRSGPWELDSFNIGEPADFAAWEEGKRPENYGPIFLQFDDVTSPTAVNELGGTYYKVSMRLMPDSYRVDAQTVLFRAKDPRLGEVVLELTPDLAAYKTALAVTPDGGDAPPVFKGSLRIGAKQIRNISFFYNPGD